MSTRSDATLSDWMEVHARERPQQTAINLGQTKVSYLELYEKVMNTAAGLQDLGLKKGDTVAIQLPNTIEFIISFLAITRCGSIVHTLHMPYQKAERSQLLSHSGAKMVICFSASGEGSPARESLALVAEIPGLETVISVGEPVAGAISLDEIQSSPPSTSLPVITPDDPFLLLYTSGTTASPKGVPHNYRGFLGNAKRSADEFNLTPADRLMSAAPFTHLYGLYVLHLALASGACNVLLPAFDPGSFLLTLRDEKPTALFSAPAHFAPFVGAGKLEPSHLSSIRFLCLSGAPVPPPLASSIETLLENGSVIQLWGMSELQAGSFGRPDDPLEKRISTAGRATPETLLRIVDGSGTAVGHGVEGELEVKGPSIFNGYLNNADETNTAFTNDGWFRTGDLATLDEEGYLSLTGRLKEIINRGGVKYNPLDIELMIMKLSQIESCAIIPYPDATLGEKACLCASLKPGTSLSLETVTALLESEGIAKYKWPERVEIVDEMPLTPTRKIMRGTLKSRIS